MLKQVTVHRDDMLDTLKRLGDKVKWVVPCNPCSGPTKVTIVYDE